MAIPATEALIGTRHPSAREVPQTDAMEEEPLDLVGISETTRTTYGNVAACPASRQQRRLGQTAVTDLTTLRRPSCRSRRRVGREVVVQHGGSARLPVARRCSARPLGTRVAATTNACVHHVNSAEPCVRGRMLANFDGDRARCLVMTVDARLPGVATADDGSISNSMLWSPTLASIHAGPPDSQPSSTMAVSDGATLLLACISVGLALAAQFAQLCRLWRFSDRSGAGSTDPGTASAANS